MKTMLVKTTRILFICWVVAICGLNASAQDTHLSQYNYSPLELNPALAGLNSCDYRIALNARTQWNTVSGGNTYSTFGASGDISVGKATRFNSFAGVGVSIQSDIAGATSYNTNRGDVTAAYHFMLNRRGTSSLSFGLQLGINHRGFNSDKSTYDAQYDPVTGKYDPSLPKESFARTNMVYIDAGAGMLYSVSFKRQRNNIYLGLALNHINQPNISWYSAGLYNATGSDKLFLKTTIHGGGSFQIGDKTWIMPNFMLLFQGPSQQYNFGSLVRLKLGNSASTTFFYLGAQFRAPLDAVIFQTRIDYKGFTIGFSYDVNVSKLTPASQTFGAPELAVLYQGCLKRKPRPFFCPFM
jgi:type IX secretion system PorP/SprF family membrane protein